MLTTEERREVKSAERRYRNLRNATAQAYADSLVAKLEADDREMFDCSESIARGDSCLSCFAHWVPTVPADGTRKLDHTAGCVYSNRLMEEDL